MGFLMNTSRDSTVLFMIKYVAIYVKLISTLSVVITYNFWVKIEYFVDFYDDT